MTMSKEIRTSKSVYLSSKRVYQKMMHNHDSNQPISVGTAVLIVS